MLYYNTIALFTKLFFFSQIILILFLPNFSYSQKLFINEFMASNVSEVIKYRPVDYDLFSDWIEIYNDSSENIDLSGYYITDNLNNPLKWEIKDGTIIKSKGFVILWADGSGYHGVNNHLNFQLSRTGEEIGLYSPDEKLIDSSTDGEQLNDVSFGRVNDGSSEWAYFGESTPGSSNITESTLNLTYSSKPEISLDPGFYLGSQIISISSSVPGTIITYTLDGSKPKSGSPVYNTPILIDSTTILKVRIFEIDKLPSKILTKSYFIDYNQNLPVLSLAVQPETFFDQDRGIYVNESARVEVPVNAQFFELNGEVAFDIDAGIRLSGEASVMAPQKPFTISADDRYGREHIDYQIFPNRKFTSYKDLYLRNGGWPDNGHTLFRDALQHGLVINDVDVDGQSYRPAVVFINSQYWGIYNFREKLNTNYYVQHHGVNPEHIDVLEYYTVSEGDRYEYEQLTRFLYQNNLSIVENYEYVKSQIDINEFLNYIISEIFYANCDWLDNNTIWWKEKTESSKWRWVLQDLDNGFGMDSEYCTSHYSHNFIEVATSHLNALRYLDESSTIVIRSLLKNEEFKNLFIQRFAIFLTTIFNENRVLNYIDNLQNQIKTEIPIHIDRWNDVANRDFITVLKDYNTWLDNVEVLKEFAENRPTYQRQHILDFFDLPGTAEIQFNVSNTEAGYISLAGIKVEDGFVGEMFRSVPLKLEATPFVGYRFVKWIGVPDSLSRRTFIYPTSTDPIREITAVFEEDNSNVLPSTITENTTLDISGSPYYAKGEILVNSGASLLVDAGVEIWMPEGGNLKVEGVLRMNGTSENPIIVRPNENSGFTQWGIIHLDSTSGECLINNVKLIGATQIKSDSSRIGSISSHKSNVVIENTTLLDSPFPIYVQYGNVEIRNCTLHSEKTSDLINVKYSESALVENCDLRGNNAFDTDAIDYDGISSGVIRGNKIYNFYGANSDGIDLGEGAQDILIEENLILNCTDKGISVGQGSTTNIKNNIIVSCGQGIGVKDDESYALIDRNTFMDCVYGVASFEKNLGSGGGKVDVVNSIISKSVESPLLVDNLSILNISYSLSDTEELNGNNNINGFPRLLNNFFLSENSPAINSGDPGSELDTDGTRADMGAKYFSGLSQPIIINEIHYNPVEGAEREFIELYNSGVELINISNYEIRGAIEYTFPQGTEIGSREIILITKNSSSYNNLVVQVFEWGEESLPNMWGNLSLFNTDGEEIDFVSYSDRFDWPNLADGVGYTLELINPFDENLVTKHWKTSDSRNGSPGFENRASFEKSLFINELQADNKRTIKDEYGEYDDWIEVYNVGSESINLTNFYYSDDFSNLAKYQIPHSYTYSDFIRPGKHKLLWADGSPNQGSNHLDFRLSGRGEQIAISYIFEHDTLIIDSVSYGELESDFSYGRERDGSANWKIIKAPTPLRKNYVPNLFENGILLVNGLNLIRSNVINSYENNAFVGNYNYRFWDLLDKPINGYPNNMPDPIGFGDIPLDTIFNYSTLILPMDIGLLNSQFFKEYILSGGNVLLLSRNAYSLLDKDIVQKMGLKWVESDYSKIQKCSSVFEGLSSLSVNKSQYLSTLFDTLLLNDDSRLLFVEDSSYENHFGVGVWYKPEHGGWYKENGGQIVYIAGRPYRYVSEDMKQNVTYILGNFFEESDIITSTEADENQLITHFKLNQNYPNPFNPSTAIKYDLLENSKVELRIYNILGQEVKTLVNEIQEKGHKTAIWNGNDNFDTKVSSGIYFYRISAGKWTDIKKMILLK